MEPCWRRRSMNGCFNTRFFHWGLKRNITHGNPKPRDERDLPDWRMRERLRTVTAALVMCLNIGVDPPDVSKTNQCSKLICWMDPSSLEVSKALPAIGRNLQAQFETLSTKTRYKQYLDPIVEETRRSALLSGERRRKSAYSSTITDMVCPSPHQEERSGSSTRLILSTFPSLSMIS